MSGKGDDRRPEADKGAFARGFDAIDWSARARDQQLRDALRTGIGMLSVDYGARVPSNTVTVIPPQKWRTPE